MPLTALHVIEPVALGGIRNAHLLAAGVGLGCPYISPHPWTSTPRLTQVSVPNFVTLSYFFFSSFFSEASSLQT